MACINVRLPSIHLTLSRSDMDLRWTGSLVEALPNAYRFAGQALLTGYAEGGRVEGGRLCRYSAVRSRLRPRLRAPRLCPRLRAPRLRPRLCNARAADM